MKTRNSTHSTHTQRKHRELKVSINAPGYVWNVFSQMVISTAFMHSMPYNFDQQG